METLRGGRKLESWKVCWAEQQDYNSRSILEIEGPGKTGPEKGKIFFPECVMHSRLAIIGPRVNLFQLGWRVLASQQLAIFISNSWCRDD